MYIVELLIYKKRDGYGDYHTVNLYTELEVNEIPNKIEEGARKVFKDDYEEFKTSINSIVKIDGAVI